MTIGPSLALRAVHVVPRSSALPIWSGAMSHWAVAVRKPTAEQLAGGERSPEEAALGEIEVKSFPLESALRRHRVLRLPVIRGIVALGGSLAIGFRALELSANAQLPPAERPAEASTDLQDGPPVPSTEAAEPQQIPKVLWIGTIVLASQLA